MDGLTNTVEAARRCYGESARVYVDGFELDAEGRPITLPWKLPTGTWLDRRLRAVRSGKPAEQK